LLFDDGLFTNKLV